MNINKALFRFIKVAFTIMVVLFVIYAFTKLGRTAYDFGYRVFTETAMEKEPGRDVLVQVDTGTSGKELGETLENKGLIRDAKLFAIQLKLSAYSHKLKPGVYTLNTSMTPKEMMVVMSTEASTENTEESEAVPESNSTEAGTE